MKMTKVETAKLHRLINAARDALRQIRFVNVMVETDNKWPALALATDTEEVLRNALDNFKMAEPKPVVKKQMFSGMRRDSAMCNGCPEYSIIDNQWRSDKHPVLGICYQCQLHDRRACRATGYNLRRVPFKCPRFGQYVAAEANREEAERMRGQ